MKKILLVVLLMFIIGCRLVTGTDTAWGMCDGSRNSDAYPHGQKINQSKCSVSSLQLQINSVSLQQKGCV